MQFNIDLAQVKKEQETSSVNESSNSDSIVSEILKEDSEVENSDYKKFDINLSDVKESEELNDILEDFDIGDELSAQLESALGAGFGANALINSNVLNEARAVMKTVVRKGKLVNKAVCPPGFKSVKGGCEKKTQKDVIAFQRRAKAAAKTRKSRKGSAAGSSKSRTRSMLVRNKNKSKVERMRSM
jgi:hypothetical protein